MSTRCRPNAASGSAPRGSPVAEAVAPDERLQLFEDGPPLGCVERRGVADVMEPAVIVVEAEEQ